MQITTVPSQDPFQIAVLLLTVIFVIIIVGYLINWIYSKQWTESNEDLKSTKTARIGLMILLIISIFGPVSLNIYVIYIGLNINLSGMWWMSINLSITDIVYGLQFLLVGLIFQLTFLRFVFVFFVYRYYKGKSTLRKAIIVGIISEMPMVVWTIIAAFLYGGFQMAFIPTPILLIAGLILLTVVPRPESGDDWLVPEGQEVWE